MPVLNANGETIHYIKEGSGPLVVLIHCLGWNAKMWREQVAAYKSRYTVLAFDMRGHGQSSAHGEISVAAVAQDLKALLDHLDVTECHLVGISTGGPVALTFAALHPAMIRSLVLADTYAEPVEGNVQVIEATAEAIAYVPMGEFGIQYAAQTLLPSTSLDIQDELAAAIAEMSPKVYVKMMRAVLLGDFKPTLAAVKAPTLVLIGDSDMIAPRSASDLLVKMISGAALDVVPTAGHLSCIDNPAAFNAAVGKFLDANHQAS
jgi:3-oxoadipate enol-lactonase